ncbi:hypothetical protein [Parasphingorhabdus cellanae]|uniref:Uncharacterized protein n=1 Tax=Parasphingorhabdus cellanae TaxID=2806553 RepID=A0ABX7T3H4_9SPHN|nr:hypothetical protein [Parasphingorhabdus cellanae]QTD55691.1 hypothetical protein J4G78_16075 [Parasphingorhabdus cellanae]
MISLTSTFGPMMTLVFDAYTDEQRYYFPGAPFIVGAALMGVAVTIYAVTVRRYYSVPN